MTPAPNREPIDQAAPAEGARPAGEVRALPRDDFDRDVWCVLGLPIDAVDISGAADTIETAARIGRPLSFVTPNLNFLVRALREPEARRQIIDADLSLADGAPVVALARMVGAPLRGRVAGSDVFEALRARPGFRGRRVRVFFFGGRPGAAEQASRALGAGGGLLESAGFLDPGHGDVDSMSDDATLAAVNAAKADFIVVALGAAKGQTWIDRNRARLDAPVIAHLGAVVDFTAGSIRRAPWLLRRVGLEWAWRIREERGLWRRYAGDAAAFAEIAATRLALQLARPMRPMGVAAAATARRGAGRTRVMLSGDLVAGALAPVRQAFREAATLGGQIEIDFSAVGAVDCAFLGQVLMLEKQAVRRGATLAASGVAPGLAALLRRNAIGFDSVETAQETDRRARARA